MRNSLIFLAALLFVYSCSEISGKETPRDSKKPAPKEEVTNKPREELRVKRDDAMEMRKRRKGDDASVKISAKDLMELMGDNRAENDSFVFYFVSYDAKSNKDRDRYAAKLKKRGDDAEVVKKWDHIKKKPSTLLVGFVGANAANSMHLMGKNRIPIIPVYDLGVVCPPPPSCGCEIEQ